MSISVNNDPQTTHKTPFIPSQMTARSAEPVLRDKAGSVSFTQTQMRCAIKLLSDNHVELKRIDSSGVLTGEIIDNDVEVTTSVQLKPDGGFELLDCTENCNHLCPHCLALVLHINRLQRSKHHNASIRKLLNQAPDWLNSGLSLEIPATVFGGGIVIGSSVVVDSLENLQAYWALMELASTGRPVIPPELLVRHVLAVYGHARWAIKRAAMEAVIRRISSAQKEKLIIRKGPANSHVIGFYRLSSEAAGSRPYAMLIAATDRIDCSCTCPDYSKNTLRFCKHIAAIIGHWHTDKGRQSLWCEAHSRANSRLMWLPPTGIDDVEDPLLGLRLISGFCEDRDKKRGLAGFFRDGRFIIPKNAVERSEALTKFEAALKKVERKYLVDPAIWPMIQKEVKSLDWSLEYLKYKRHLLTSTQKLKVNLYAYQKLGVEAALGRGRFLLGDDMGLGKTMQAIAWAEALMTCKLAKTVLVICPAALKSQWKREWWNANEREIKIVEGSPQDREKAYKSGCNVLIINYELILKDLDKLLRLAPDAVILDEAQRIKNFAAETSRRVKCLKPKFRLVLTGTPMENRIQELSSLMDWVADGAMGPSWRLASELSFSDGDGHGQSGVRGLALMRKRLGPHLLRRLRSEVLTDLPSRTDSPIFIGFTDEQRDIHDEYGRRAAKLARIAERRPLTPEEHMRLMMLLTQMRIVSNGVAQHDYESLWGSLQREPAPEIRLAQLSSPKLQEFRNIIEGLLTQEGVKVVIFSQWQRMLRLSHWAIGDLLQAHGVEAVFFTGAETQRRRTENIVRFHDEPQVRLFFATDAGGVGLNLQTAATVCINLELPWNPAVLEQRIGRIYRLGQKKPIQVFNLITQGSIEERITALVGQKKAVFDALFDGHSDQVVFDGSTKFYSQVQNVMHDLKIIPSAAMEEADTEEAEVTLEDGTVMPAEITSAITVDTVTADKICDATTTTSAFTAPEQMQKAFGGIKIQKSADGALKIEASPGAAVMLEGLFRGMADLLAKAI